MTKFALGRDKIISHALTTNARDINISVQSPGWFHFLIAFKKLDYHVVILEFPRRRVTPLIGIMIDWHPEAIQNI
jgi:hypothetical protein